MQGRGRATPLELGAWESRRSRDYVDARLVAISLRCAVAEVAGHPFHLATKQTGPFLQLRAPWTVLKTSWAV